jgi:two-component system phosphate regulon response regulator PhoB
MEGMAITHTHGSAAPSESVPFPVAERQATERRVLIIENDSASVAALHSKLSQAGFKVSTAVRGEDARAAIERDSPHLIMIDWDLPAMIALDLVRHVRRDASHKGPRLIALSSFAGEQHVVSGFELGVDDYVIKPFSVPEVVARVRAVLRPMRGHGEESAYLEFRELQMDAASGRVTIIDKTITLRNMEFQLLQFLMRRPERAYSREALLNQVWGGDSDAGMRAVDVTIQRIRRALAPHGCGGYLQTIRGVGYRLSAGES